MSAVLWLSAVVVLALFVLAVWELESLFFDWRDFRPMDRRGGFHARRCDGVRPGGGVGAARRSYQALARRCVVVRC